MSIAIVLDTETTGLDPKVDRLVELAAIRVSSDLQFSSLCDPGRDIPPEAKAVHHITEEMVFNRATPRRATELMLQEVGKPDLIVAHNAKFDRGFMDSLLAPLQPKWICTYKCAVMLWPDAPSHTNQVLRYWLGLEPKLPDDLAPHRALYDIIVTREIFRRQLDLAPVEQLLEWSNNPILLNRVAFGKHKGKLWSEVDHGYLRWCLTQADMNEDVLHTARHYMENRRGR